MDDELFMQFAKEKSTQQFLSLQPTWKMLLMKALDASQTDQDVMEANALDVLYPLTIDINSLFQNIIQVTYIRF